MNAVADAIFWEDLRPADTNKLPLGPLSAFRTKILCKKHNYKTFLGSTYTRQSALIEINYSYPIYIYRIGVFGIEINIKNPLKYHC